MRKQMVECEDGRRRQARMYGVPREEGDFTVLKAGVRVKGRHVTGEAWHNAHLGVWYFLSGPEGKNLHLLPRRREKPQETTASIFRTHSIRTA